MSLKWMQVWYRQAYKLLSCLKRCEVAWIIDLTSALVEVGIHFILSLHTNGFHLRAIFGLNFIPPFLRSYYNRKVFSWTKLAPHLSGKKINKQLDFLAISDGWALIWLTSQLCWREQGMWILPYPKQHAHTITYRLNSFTCEIYLGCSSHLKSFSAVILWNFCGEF